MLLYFVVDWVAVVDSCKLDLNLNSEITNVVDRDSVREIYFLGWYFFLLIEVLLTRLTVSCDN